MIAIITVSQAEKRAVEENSSTAQLLLILPCGLVIIDKMLSLYIVQTDDF